MPASPAPAPDLDALYSSPLDDLKLRASPDPVKTDLEVVCARCGECLCDAEAGDRLTVLLSVGAEHTCGDVTP